MRSGGRCCAANRTGVALISPIAVSRGVSVCGPREGRSILCREGHRSKKEEGRVIAEPIYGAGTAKDRRVINILAAASTVYGSIAAICESGHFCPIAMYRGRCSDVVQAAGRSENVAVAEIAFAENCGGWAESVVAGCAVRGAASHRDGKGKDLAIAGMVKSSLIRFGCAVTQVDTAVQVGGGGDDGRGHFNRVMWGRGQNEEGHAGPILKRCYLNKI